MAQNSPLYILTKKLILKSLFSYLRRYKAEKNNYYFMEGYKILYLVSRKEDNFDDSLKYSKELVDIIENVLPKEYINAWLANAYYYRVISLEKKLTGLSENDPQFVELLNDLYEILPKCYNSYLICLPDQPILNRIKEKQEYWNNLYQHEMISMNLVQDLVRT